jgi:hypothetical protein
MWRDKPTPLGYMLPKYYAPGSKVSWGPGIVGHIAHEGGWPFLLFYAAFFGFMFKYFDTAIIENPKNLFLQGLMACLMPHCVIIIRGDIGVNFMAFAATLVFFYLFRRVAIMLYGRQQRRERIQLLARQPFVRHPYMHTD